MSALGVVLLWSMKGMPSVFKDFIKLKFVVLFCFCFELFFYDFLIIVGVEELSISLQLLFDFLNMF